MFRYLKMIVVALVVALMTVAGEPRDANAGNAIALEAKSESVEELFHLTTQTMDEIECTMRCTDRHSRCIWSCARNVGDDREENAECTRECNKREEKCEDRCYGYN